MRLIVAGASGRMGRALIRAVAETEGAELAGALERPGSEHLGRDAGDLAGVDPLGVSVTDDALPLVAAADGLLDFTAPEATVALAELAAQARIVHVIGTTGFSPAHIDSVDAAARHAVVIRSGNMSLGVNLLAALVRQAAKALGPDWDIEVLEMHHRAKVDAPSGTALLLGQAAAEGRDVSLAEQSVRTRDGHTGARVEGTIGFATLRGGSVVGDHTVILAGAGERVELSHRAEDRMIFARGAVKAALWGFRRKPGHYGMADVLGLHEG
ncbi:4-hydroxy-tetrahydrodipicolinate reductase [Methylopila musalis]|uniref:4-hydroxy-tetrahydrodipicolinate reductase n=1 Tax=Methylopila musalis TaxID=1134781 RepID=A0ABW3ZAM8_9HYPH